MNDDPIAQPPPLPAIDTTDAGGADVEADSRKRIMRGMGVLGVLLAAGVGLLGFMYLKSGPAEALAGGAKQKAVSEFLGGGKKDVDTMRSTLGETDKIVDQFRNFPAAQQVPLKDLHKNPFSTRDPSETKPSEQAGDDREHQKKLAIAAAGKLKLQSIMYGEQSRSCLIDGKFRTEGDEFGGFTLVRIESDSVIVRYGGVLLRLQVKQ